MSSWKEADPEVKLPRPIRVKNETPAPIQITADQILREDRERQGPASRPPRRKITDSAELEEYRLRVRKEFEDPIRRDRWSIGLWMKYAKWEELQKDLNRARSVWERAVEVHYKNHTLWLKYAEFEMKNRFIKEARNVLERAVTVLPRVDELWYKYIRMEEMLGNVAGAKQVCERWLKWSPEQQGHGQISCNPKRKMISEYDSLVKISEPAIEPDQKKKKYNIANIPNALQYLCQNYGCEED